MSSQVGENPVPSFPEPMSDREIIVDYINRLDGKLDLLLVEIMELRRLMYIAPAPEVKAQYYPFTEVWADQHGIHYTEQPPEPKEDGA